jgi:hypothetical protein
MINIQSTIRTPPDLCKKVSLPVLFDNNGNSYTVCTQWDMCVHVYIYTHIIYNIEIPVEQKK